MPCDNALDGLLRGYSSIALNIEYICAIYNLRPSFIIY